MRYFLQTILLLFFTYLCVAQSPNSNNLPQQVSSKEVYTFVDNMPAPDYNLVQYIRDNLHYPQAAIDSSISGKVILKFIVNEDGTISDCTIAKKLCEVCDNEALKLMQNMPKWKPGTKNGIAVKVSIMQPVNFSINKEDTSTPTLDKVYTEVDQMPEPVYELGEYISENMHYPDSAKLKNISGKVVVDFVVMKTALLLIIK